MTHRIIGAAPLILLCAAALAQDQPPSRHPPEDAPVLAGPRVEGTSRATLITRDSDGAIRRTEVPPEVAALRFLELPDSVHQAVDAILIKRSRFIEKFIEKNLDLLTKLDTAGQTGDKLDQAALGIEALSKLAPITRGGSLKKQIRQLLPMDQVERFDAVLKEYWDAIVAQEKTKDATKSRFEILAGERAQSFIREVTAAFQRIEKSGVLLYAYFFAEMKLSPDQEGEIRALLDEFVDETKGSPTKQQEQKIFVAVMSKLDPKQQTELIRQFKAREKP